jgi:hypothetical protein
MSVAEPLLKFLDTTELEELGRRLGERKGWIRRRGRRNGGGRRREMTIACFSFPFSSVGLVARAVEPHTPTSTLARYIQ